VGSGCLSLKQIGQGQGVGHDGRGRPWFVGGQGALTEEEPSGTGHDVEAVVQRRWAYGIVVVVDTGRESTRKRKQ
jgi:hypothetical protein